MSRAAAAVAALLVVLVALPPAPARAQGGEDAVAPVEIRLREVDAVLDPADPEAAVTATVELRAGPVVREDLRLVTTVHARVATRAALLAALDGDLPAVSSATSTDLTDLHAGATRLLQTRSPAAELSLLGDGREGVYPVSLQVFEGPDPVGAVVTAAIVLPVDPPAPLPATTLVRLSADAPPTADDVADPALEALVAPAGPLLRAVEALISAAADGSAAGLAVAVDGRLAGDLQAMADGFTRPAGTVVAPDARAARRAAAALAGLARVAGRADTELLAPPYGPADLVALVRAGLADHARELLAAGPDATAAALDGAATADVVLPPDGLDAATLAVVGEASPEAVLLDEAYLASPDAGAMAPLRVLRTADGGQVQVLVPDAGLSALVADLPGRGTAAVVQQLLAETAVTWLRTAPGEDGDGEDGAGDGGTADEGEAVDPRATGVLLALDPLDGPAADPGQRPDVAAITGAIAAAPWLRPVSLSALLEAVDPSARLVRLAYPPRAAASELPPAYTARLGTALAALQPLRALLPEDDPSTDTLADALQEAASTAYRDPDRQPAGAARVERVLARLDDLAGGVRIIESPPITLTATTGEVPVTIVNEGTSPLRLRVSVASARFAFPLGAVQTVELDAASSRRLTFRVQALSPGALAPITVTVDDPGGLVVLARTRLSVRSTAFPVAGLLVAGLAVVLLLAWGVRQGRRRPGRHERATAERTAA